MEWVLIFKTASLIFGMSGLVLIILSNIAMLSDDKDTQERGQRAKMSTIPIILLAILFYLWGSM